MKNWELKISVRAAFVYGWISLALIFVNISGIISILNVETDDQDPVGIGLVFMGLDLLFGLMLVVVWLLGVDVRKEPLQINEGLIIARWRSQFFEGTSEEPSEMEYVFLLERNGRTEEVLVSRDEFYDPQFANRSYYKRTPTNNAAV